MTFDWYSLYIQSIISSIVCSFDGSISRVKLRYEYCTRAPIHRRRQLLCCRIFSQLLPAAMPQMSVQIKDVHAWPPICFSARYVFMCRVGKVESNDNLIRKTSNQHKLNLHKIRQWSWIPVLIPISYVLSW